MLYSCMKIKLCHAEGKAFLSAWSSVLAVSAQDFIIDMKIGEIISGKSKRIVNHVVTLESKDRYQIYCIVYLA